MCNLEKEHSFLNCFEHSLTWAAPLSHCLLILFLNEEHLKGTFFLRDLMSAFKLLEFGVDLGKFARFLHVLSKMTS